MKDILYITLKVQAAQNDLEKKNYFKIFFTINSPAKTGQQTASAGPANIEKIQRGLALFLLKQFTDPCCYLT